MKVTVIRDETGRPIIYRMTDDGQVGERLSRQAAPKRKENE